MTDALSPCPPLDLEAIRERSRRAREWWAGEMEYEESACDVPNLLREIERLRAEKDRLASEPYAWAVQSKDEGGDWERGGLWYTDDACGEEMVRIVEVAEDAGVKVRVRRVPLIAIEPTNEEKP